MIYTFYSFKGGVGRSMALANIAELLYSRGLKVLMIDFDLEAPGLERYFDVPRATNLADVLTQRGVIDMLNSYKELRSLPKLNLPGTQAPKPDRTDEATADNDAELEREKFPFSVEPLSSFIVPIYKTSVTGGSLSLLPAGRRARSENVDKRRGPDKKEIKNEFVKYAERVRSFNWDDFYLNWEGELFFEWFRKEAEGMADVVLVDSRTGVTEMSGVCTYHLADVVVMFVAANNQNLSGTKMMADSLANPLLVTEGRKGRKLSLVFVPSRVEPFESSLLVEFQRDFEKDFGKLILDSGLKFERTAFLDLKIPYATSFAFKEDVAVREPTQPNAAELVRAYDKITGTLAQLEPRDSRMRRIFHPIERANVFISYKSGPELDEAMAREIAQAVGKQHYVFYDKMLLPGDRWADRLKSELEKADVQIVLLSKEATSSRWIRQELATAVELAATRNLSIIPVRLAYDEPLPPEFGYYLNDILWFSWHGPEDTPRLMEELLRAIASNTQVAAPIGMEAKPSATRLSAEETEQTTKPPAKIIRRPKVLEGLKTINSASRIDLSKLGWVLAITITIIFSTPVKTWIADLFSRAPDGVTRSRALAANSQEQLASDPQLSLLLAIESAKASPTPEAEAALRKALFRLQAEGPDTSFSASEYVRAPINCAEFAPGGRLVVTGSTDGSVSLWDPDRINRTIEFQAHRVAINDVRFTNSGTLFVTAAREGTVRVWRQSNKDSYEVAQLRGHNDWVVSARFDAGFRVVTASFDDTARVWELSNNNQMVELRGHSGNVYTAEFDITGKFVVTASEDKTARVWDSSTGREIFVLRHDGPLRSAAFSPKGNLIVTASTDRTAKVWETATGNLVATLEGHSDWVTRAGFSPDEKLVVTASNDSTARVWEAATGKSVAVFQGHKNWVWSAEFNPDGKRVVTSSRDGTAQLWEANTGEVLEKFPGAAVSAKFNAEGNLILTVDRDNKAYLYRCEYCGTIDDLLKAARGLVSREFTKEERERYSL
ncbi:MAG TPA: TIR domain-containing protein [Blastocatellia bacterium]|nr:TIR domain-containing protein [Blastocatellia bacterium]